MFQLVNSLLLQLFQPLMLALLVVNRLDDTDISFKIIIQMV